MNKITIIKIGSNVLVDDAGSIRNDILENILLSVGEKIKQGEKIILVSSGAIAVGKHIFDEEVDKRLSASLGQMRLMANYLEVGEKINLKVSELLLSRPYLVKRELFLQLQKTIDNMLQKGVVPIVNENDALVVGSDWSFGDNDSLASALAIAFSADKLLILSSVDGLFKTDPTKDKNAELINKVEDVNAELMEYCSKETSTSGRGGMVSKLKTIRLSTAVGIETQIINGLKKDKIKKSLENEEVGTLFSARKMKQEIKNRDRWILAAKSSAASIEVDDGAIEALQAGKSLLAVGIKKIFGDFNRGEIVELINYKKEGIAFGVVDIDSKDLTQEEFKKQKGVQVMHADNIMVFA